MMDVCGDIGKMEKWKIVNGKIVKWKMEIRHS